jgi:hypothetical protein
MVNSRGGIWFRICSTIGSGSTGAVMLGEREKEVILRDSAFTFLSPRGHPEREREKGRERRRQSLVRPGLQVPVAPRIVRHALFFSHYS